MGSTGWRRIVLDASSPANAEPRTLVHETARALGVDCEEFSRERSDVIVETVIFALVVPELAWALAAAG
jgi:hypothetical protein